MSKLNSTQTAHNNLTENNTAGVLCGLAAFVIWGLVPIFFKEISHVPPLEFLAHRMVWSFVLLIFMLFFRRSLPTLIKDVRAIMSNRRLLMMLFASATLISCNWLIYIWAVANNHVVEASLGYFINPLVNVAFGILFLGERLTKTKLMAVGLAAIGVLYMVVNSGIFPWIALVLGVLFALYGLIRKKAHVGSVIGLWIELLLLMPVVIGYMLYVNVTTGGGFMGIDKHDDYTWMMLMLSGVVTTAPLVLFASAAIRIPLSTIGLLQYIAPSMSLLLAIFLWHEPFTSTHLVAFSCIWGALIIYSVDSFILNRKRPVSPL
ncbi:EamA family transporter RarD [Paremcibacter congregatus]|uniref:EamA family transporter RarD n=1 Tax=Paremcibacter congregatus TaxID=2043170 RepID=UPI003A8CBB53|tara:strand:- start:752 stop:1708 length:957 start_codon:yes stop_codon:yes gene_type:complete